MAQIIPTFVRPKLFTEKNSFRFTRFVSYKVLFNAQFALMCRLSCLVMTTRNLGHYYRGNERGINLRLVRDYSSILFLVIVNISELHAMNANVLRKMML